MQQLFALLHNSQEKPRSTGSICWLSAFNKTQLLTLCRTINAVIPHHLY